VLDDLRINVELERTGAGPDAFSSCNFKAAMVVCCAWLIVYIMMAVYHYATVAGQTCFGVQHRRNFDRVVFELHFPARTLQPATA
jgi:hypothetical protein